MDDNLEPLIDDVARAMTSAPGDARLAERVAARIAGPHSPRARALPWLLATIAAAAVLVIAVFVARQKPAPGIVRLTPDATSTKVDVEIAASPAARVAPIINTPPTAVDPIEINAVDVPPLVDMDEIQIGTIAIAPIDIAPMP